MQATNDTCALQDVYTEIEMLRGFLAFVATSPYSRPLQVAACPLRQALQGGTGRSRLSVADISTDLNAPVSTIKSCHRRLVKDGVLSRTAVAGKTSETSIIIPCLGAYRPTGGTEYAPSSAPAPIPQADTCVESAGAPDTASAAQPGDEPPSPLRALRLKHERSLERGILNDRTQSTITLPDPVSRTSAVSASQPANEHGGRASPAALRTMMDIINSGGVAPARAETPQPVRAEVRKPVRAEVRKPARAVLPKDQSEGSTEFFEKIERAVETALSGCSVPDNYPNTRTLALQIAWSLVEGVYRDKSFKEGLRICIATVRRGTWDRPKHFSESEANALIHY